MSKPGIKKPKPTQAWGVYEPDGQLVAACPTRAQARVWARIGVRVHIRRVFVTPIPSERQREAT